MSGLICGVCGVPWKLDKPLLYHHDQLHCDSHACSRECPECKDWEHAVEGGATPCATGADQKADPARLNAHEGPASKRDSDAERGNPHTTGPNASPPPPGSFTKAPGYAAMMARLKGGESK